VSVDLVQLTVCTRQLGEGGHNSIGGERLMELAGYRARNTTDVPWSFGRDEIVWIQRNVNWFPKIRRQLLATPQDRRPFVVIWHTEPLPLPPAAGIPTGRLSLKEIGRIIRSDPAASDVYTNYRRLRQLATHEIPDLLVVSTRSRQEFLAGKGIAAEWVPLGYRPSMGRDLNISRDIDVLFLGVPSDRRRKSALEYLRKRGVEITVMGGPHDPAVWGEGRTALINRAKVFLNVYRNPGELSGLRMLLGMANKALVVSEPMYDPAPYVPGRHFVSSTIEDMPEVIERYLRSDVERNAITTEAFSFLTQHLRMNESLKTILKLIKTSRGTQLAGERKFS
jgi:hypothetical protein